MVVEDLDMMLERNGVNGARSNRPLYLSLELPITPKQLGPAPESSQLSGRCSLSVACQTTILELAQGPPHAIGSRTATHPILRFNQPLSLHREMKGTRGRG